MNLRTSRLIRIALAVVALAFGVATVLSGGRVLFGGEAARAAAGDYVAFVVWFNFLAGFAYIAAGLGLAFRQAWASGLALAIALATGAVFLVFGVTVLTGTAFEARTVGAMSLRLTVWAAIAWAARRL